MNPVPVLRAKGAAIPALGFGTSSLGARCGEVVASALRRGYRHIDTARKYGSEPGVGAALRAAGVARADIFLTTKVSHENLRPDDFARSVETSLETLGVDYVDALLLHWPNPEIPLAPTMAALARAKREGLARHLGVANFNIALLDQAIQLSPEPLALVQAEFHPYLDQSRLLAACRARGMLFTGYCPLGRGRLLNDPVLGEVARAKGKSSAQVALRWTIQQGVIPIPRSSNPSRMAENFDVFGFSLGPEDMQRIHALRARGERIANPVGRAPVWD